MVLYSTGDGSSLEVGAGAVRSCRGHRWNHHESVGDDGYFARFAVGCVGSDGDRN